MHYPLKIQALDILQDDFIQVSCGSQHVLLLTKSLEVISCGDNKYG